MDFRVEITDPAIADLAEIVSYIARDNPEAAAALGHNLLDAALSLQSAPLQNQSVSKADRYSEAQRRSIQDILSRW